MKKMILAIAITAVSAGLVMAQNNGGEKGPKQKTEKAHKGGQKGKPANAAKRGKQGKQGKGPMDSSHREMNPEKRAEKMTARMKESLSLTPSQEVQVKAANLEMLNSMKALHAQKQEGTDKQGLKKDGKAIRAAYDAKLRTILTAEQYTKLETLKKEAREKHGQGGMKAKHGKGGKDSAHKEMNPEKRAEKMTAKMKEKLSLTAAQEVQVKAANLELANRMKALHEKKQQGEDKEGLKKTGKLVREEYNAKIKGILTAEQLTQWEAMKKEAADKHGKKGGAKGDKAKGKPEKADKQKKTKE